MAEILFLEYDPRLVPHGGAEVVCQLPAMNKAHWMEPAGSLFHQVALRQSGFSKSGTGDEGEGDDTEAKSGESKDASDPVDLSGWESAKKKKKKGKKGKEGEIEEDHYALIGLAHLRYLATEDQIKKAYRDAALKYHPDKLSASLMEETSESEREVRKEQIEARFKAIQEAYEILTDPVKRRDFDSRDEFDDTVPTDCGPEPEDFFKVFGSAFLRNGRWSIVQPCPMPGDLSTPMEEVDAFYDYWWGFKSWREFPNEDEEHDLESAESREEKRWMERQNSKMREKAKKEESARIRLLVETAFKKDPRIARRKEEEKLEKLRKKEAKNAAKRAAEEEEKRAAEEEKKRAEEESRRAAEEASALKKQKEKDKKNLRKERARLRTLAAGVAAIALKVRSQGLAGWGVTEGELEDLCQGLEMDQIKALCDRLESMADDARRALTLQRWFKVLDGESAWEGNLPAGDAEAEVASDAEFATGVHSSFVANGVQENSSSGAHVPEASVANGRANGVANGVKQQKVAGKKVVPEKVDLAAKKVEEKKKEEKPWTEEEQKMLRKGLVKFPKGIRQRWQVIADYIGTGRTPGEVSSASEMMSRKPDDKKAFEILQKKLKSPKPIASPLTVRDDAPFDSPDPKSNSAAEPNTPSQDAESRETEKETGTDPKSPGKKGKSEETAWSEAAVGALVNAMKAFPKETENRWDRIAAAVPGKSKAQCFRKFSSLREKIRSKKDDTKEGASSPMAAAVAVE